MASDRVTLFPRPLTIGNVQVKTPRLVLFALGLVTGATLAVRWVTRRAALITPPAFAPLLLSPLRMIYRAPSQLIRFLDPQPDWTVLDLGCGNGAFALPLARHVRHVHAVDVQPAMVAALRERLRQAHLDNVTARVAPATHLPFDAETFDAVLMISVLPMLHDRDAALSEARRVLKPNGVLIVGEERIEPEYVGWRTVARWVERAGLALQARVSNLLCYTLKFGRKPEAWYTDESHKTPRSQLTAHSSQLIAYSSLQ